MSTVLKSGIDFANSLLEINIEDLNDNFGNLVNPQFVSSYNWLGNPKDPRIVVPGAPKRLLHWNGGKLTPDTNQELMADENHAMLADCPLQPLFLAVKMAVEDDEAPVNDAESKSFKFQKVDIATDRNNLRKLFSLIDPSTKRIDKSFRFDLQLVNNLVMFIRVEERDTEIRRTKTYGQDFERKMTAPENDLCSGSFRQIITYRFGNVNIMTRFEIDAADYDLSESKTDADKRHRQNKQVSLASVANATLCLKKKDDLNANRAAAYDDVTVLTARLGGVSLATAKTDDIAGPVRVVQYGHWRRYHFVEIATRRDNSSFPTHTFPQLYFAHVPTLIIGYHNWGFVKSHLITKYSIKDVEDQVGGFPSEKMAMLADLLEKIVTFCRQHAKKAHADDRPRILSVFWQPSFGNVVKIFEVANPTRFGVTKDMERYIAAN